MSPKKEVVDNDPHFLVHVGGTPVCFDFHGGNNDVIQLLNDDVTGQHKSVLASFLTLLINILLFMGSVEIRLAALSQRVTHVIA